MTPINRLPTPRWLLPGNPGTTSHHLCLPPFPGTQARPLPCHRLRAAQKRGPPPGWLPLPQRKPMGTEPLKAGQCRELVPGQFCTPHPLARALLPLGTCRSLVSQPASPQLRWQCLQLGRGRGNSLFLYSLPLVLHYFVCPCANAPHTSYTKPSQVTSNCPFSSSYVPRLTPSPLLSLLSSPHCLLSNLLQEAPPIPPRPGQPFQN